MTLYKNKYRSETTRLQTWDYSWNGAYYITICTKNKIHYFGEIADKKFIPSAIGQLAEKFWMEIPNHFPFVELGNFVVMPNHTHGILIINKPDSVAGTSNLVVDTPNLVVGTPNLGVPTTASPETTKKNGGKNEKWKPQTIGVMINQYKRIVTIHARKLLPEFTWQSRFHDHIIRDSQSFQNISNYIKDNPRNWGKDDHNGQQ